jgi:ABC-2 type transport system permease protein
MRSWRAVRLVAMREILERGRSRGYVLSLLFTLFLLVAGFVLPQFLLADQPTRLALVEPVPAGLEAAVLGTASAYELDLAISTVPDRAAAEAALSAKSIDAALAVPADLSGPGELIVLEQAGPKTQAVASGAVVALRAADAAALLAPPAVTILEPPTEEDITAIIFANAGIILMFIGIFSYGTWVLTGVVEEKQSRVVEVVLSTVRPRDVLMGKVLGIGALALAQIVVLVAAGIAAAQLSGRLTLPPTTVGAVVQLLVWFILGFALYSTAMGFLGALASRVEDASNASMPVTMTATACYLLSILLVTQDPSGVLARVMTFFPPAAPMVVPLRAALGAIEPWEVAVSIAIMLVSIWVMFVVGARVYAGAVLQVGSRIRIRDAWRARS